MSKTPIPSVRIPASTLRSSQCLVGNGLFKSGVHATFDPNVDMVSVEELVEGVKSCEERLNSLRQEQFVEEKQKKTSVRSRSPVPISKRPAWGRNTPQQRTTPQRTPSPTTTPRTQSRPAAVVAGRVDQRERPWRTTAKTATEHHEKEHIDKEEGTEKDHVSTPRAERAAPASASTRTARTTTTRKPFSKPTPALDLQKKKEEEMQQLKDRLEKLEQTVATTQLHNEELTRKVQQLEHDNESLRSNQQLMMSDMTGKWIALSSQMQYLMQQSMSSAAPNHNHRPPSTASTVSAIPVQQYHPSVPYPQSHHISAQPGPIQERVVRHQAFHYDHDDAERVSMPRPTSSTSDNSPNPEAHTARRLDMSSESIHSVTRLPPSPPMHLHMQPSTSPSH